MASHKVTAYGKSDKELSKNRQYLSTVRSLAQVTILVLSLPSERKGNLLDSVPSGTPARYSDMRYLHRPQSDKHVVQYSPIAQQSLGHHSSSSSSEIKFSIWEEEIDQNQGPEMYKILQDLWSRDSNVLSKEALRDVEVLVTNMIRPGSKYWEGLKKYDEDISILRGLRQDEHCQLQDDLSMRWQVFKNARKGRIRREELSSHPLG
ncbi:hypothetical protein BDZ89DRAFT_569757 [Hymenopellis radicata]|nr:hypothetical protein BDZ89DRAFT_569757 [Hymenopellis radicata]